VATRFPVRLSLIAISALPVAGSTEMVAGCRFSSQATARARAAVSGRRYYQPLPDLQILTLRTTMWPWRQRFSILT